MEPARRRGLRRLLCGGRRARGAHPRAATGGGARFPRFVGRDAIRERIAGFIEAVPDLTVEVLRVGEGPEDTAWLEWRLTGTHRRDWGAWAARGEPVDVPAVSVYRVRDGLIAEEAEYIDPAVMMTPPE